MDPQLLRGNFALALFILFLALLILPFQDTGSGAFVVTILAIVVAFLFIGAIALAARWSAPRVPKEKGGNADDKPTRTGYNDPRPGTPASVEPPGEGEGR